MEEPKTGEKDPRSPGRDERTGEKETIATQSPAIKQERPEVITIRNWREYLGESLLIVFSVVLALVLTEWFAKLHEQGQTRQVLRQLREELINNRKAEQQQYRYHLAVLRNIDSALNHPTFAQKFMNNGVLDLTTIAPQGVMSRDLNDVAWQLAKQNNVVSKIDLHTYSLLTDIYDNQQRIIKAEDEIGKILLSWESRKPENLRTTLTLVKDNYHAWAVDRAPALIEEYGHAIDELKNY